jgi:hypothetical protein
VRSAEARRCVGSSESSARCGIRPTFVVVGADYVDGVEGLVFGVVCLLHRDDVGAVLTAGPLGGCWAMTYEPAMFGEFLAEWQAEGPTWELQPAEAG